MEVEYRLSERMNQSLLKKILVSPSSFLKAEKQYKEGDSEEEHFIFGSIVDHLLTEDTPLEDKYFFMEESAVSDAIKNIVKDIYSFAKDAYSKEVKTLDDVLDEDILQIIKYYQYQSKWKDETRVNAIRRDGSNYFNSLLASEGKIIVPNEERQKAMVCKAALISNPYTRQYFVKMQDVEIIKKFVVNYTYDDVDCKGELDLVAIDHKNGTITPLDIKTTGQSIHAFPYNFWKLRYDFQAASYVYGLKQHPMIQDLLNKDYYINNFRFIVVEKDCNNQPFMFRVSKEIEKIGFEGGILSNGRELEGFQQAIRRYKFHMRTDNWDYPMEVIEQNGVIDIER